MGNRGQFKIAPPCWYPFWKESSWCYDFYVERCRFRRSTGVCDPSKIEIAKLVAEGVHDAAWERALSPCPTFREAAALYVVEIGKHENELEPIVAYFGPNVRIDEIDAFMIKQCKVSLSKADWKAGTMRRQVSVPLKAVVNNALGLRPERHEDNVRKRILSPEEAERLINTARNPPKNIRDPHYRLLKMIAFLLGSGATPGEMFCVRAKDINRPTGEVYIRGEEVGAGKTAYRARMLQLPERSWDLMGDLPSTGRIFLSTTGKEVVPDGRRGSTVIRQFHKLCEAADLPQEDANNEKLVFYSFRHTWATWFSAQVGDQDRLIDRGGWSDAEMARRYRKYPTADLADRLSTHGWEFKQ
ncbi:MAG: tyrosine-type recombinase/integrase [Sulfitobacter sp.]